MCPPSCCLHARSPSSSPVFIGGIFAGPGTSVVTNLYPALLLSCAGEGPVSAFETPCKCNVSPAREGAVIHSLSLREGGHPIEERASDELLKMTGRTSSGEIVTLEIAAPGSRGANPGFDVTPAHLVTGLITERGSCPATNEGLLSLFPEHRTLEQEKK